MTSTTNFVRILKTVMAIPTTVQHLPVKQLKTVEEVILDILVELKTLGTSLFWRQQLKPARFLQI